MTDPILTLETAQLSVEPGGQVSTRVTIRNLGSIVEGFTLTVLGDEISGWAQVTPAEVQIYPEQEASAIVIIAPPAGAARSGSFAFGVRAESVVDANSSAVVEGDLEVGRVFGLQARLTPVTSTGRWRGRHLIELTNWGNSPVRIKLTANDPDERLAFFVHPEFLELPIGAAGRAGVQVKTRRPFLRGTQVRLPFQVVGEPDPPEPVAAGPISPIPNPRRASADGAFQQKPILSRLVVVLATLLVLGLGAGLYFALTGSKAEPAAALGVGAPATPALTAAALDSSSAQLSWEAQANLQTYKIFTLTPDGKTAGVTSIDGALDTYAVTELTPETQTCFQIQAIRGELSSLLSEVVCVQTPAAPVSSESSVGTESSAATDVAASPGSGPTQSPVVTTAAGTEVAPGHSSPVVQAPTSAGQGGAGQGGAGQGGAGQGGGPVAPGGVGTTTVNGSITTVTASGAGGPVTDAPAGQFGSGQYIDVVWSSPITDGLAAQRAEQKKAELIAVGIPALVLDSSQYPDLELFEGAGPLAQASYLVYIGPFQDKVSAETYCSSQPSLAGYCIAARPSPRG